MTDLWRLIKLFYPYRGWVLLGIVLSSITLLANIALMAVSSWFIASMAIAGIAGVSMNYFSPAAMIRGAAIFRTAGRYGERLVTHEATFRLLSSLRLWFYRHRPRLKIYEAETCSVASVPISICWTIFTYASSFLFLSPSSASR